MELKLIDFEKVLIPLIEDLNTLEGDGTQQNFTYKERIYSALVFRFAPKANLYNVWAITISIRDSVLNNYSCKEINKKVMGIIDSTISIGAILYPEISPSNRYHYHGILWTRKETSMDYEIIFKMLNRHIGNCYSQRTTFTTNEYKAYNQKKKCDQTTSFEKIISYITKQVNCPKLLSYLNADQKINNKLELNKSYIPKKVTPVITNITPKMTKWYFEHIIDRNDIQQLDEFSAIF